MIKEDLLKILACPICKKDVVLVEEGSFLKCDHCSKKYPIRDDIPVMLIDEAVDA